MRVLESSASTKRSSNMVPRLLVLGFVYLLLILSPANSQNCEDKNPFIKVLKNQGVIIYAQPQTTTTNTCKYEWSTYKTCCDSNSLIQYGNKDTDSLRAAILSIQTELGKASTILQDALGTLEPVQTEISKLLEQTALKDDIAEFQKFSSYYANTKAQLTPQQDSCLQRMTQLRTRSLCSTCSGRSQIFFEGNFARMSEKDCRSTIDSCHNAWRTIINLADAMSLAKSIAIRLKDYAGTAVFPFNLNAAEPIEIWLKNSDVREQLLVCTQPLTSCPLASAEALCESLISVQKKTFIESAVSYVLGDLSELATIKKATAALQAKITAIKEKAKQSLASLNNEKIRWKDTQFCRTSNWNALKSLYGLATGTQSTASAVGSLVNNVAGNFGSTTQNTVSKVTSLWGLGKRRMLQILFTNQSFSDVQIASSTPTSTAATMNFDESFP